MNVQAAYQRWATSYDEVANPTRDLDARVMREKFSRRRLARVLELGCGTGKNTPLLACIAEQLVAMDFSRAMLDIAQAKAPASNVSFLVADLTLPWPLDGARFDLITCNLVLEHVLDLQPVFDLARQHLAPGGQFFVCELHPARQYLGSQARFQHEGREHKIPAYMHHLSDYLAAAAASGLKMIELQEWWDQTPASQASVANLVAVAGSAQSTPLGLPPRLLSIAFVG